MHRKLYASIVPVLLLGLLLMLTSCVAPAAPAAEAPAAEEAAAAAPAAADAEMSPEMAELVAAAQAEGQLTTIALPPDWCNYRGVIDTFTAKYGITVNELDPNAGSADEIEAIRANRESTGPQAPDVVDVGFAYGPEAQAEGLLMPYKVSTWDSIPDEVKDPEGYWYGDYYGVMAFLVNTDVVETVPQAWADLVNPEYANQFALSGDPRASNQAILSIQAASLANGGSLGEPTAGLELMKQINDAGNLVPVVALPGTVALGETPITAVWDYNALSWVDGFDGNPATQVVIPSDGRLAGIYVQAISAFAPHPNAAKLWMEFLYSDEGQLLWMEGYCRPIREADLRERGAVPEEIAARLPDATGVVFPTIDELVAGKELIVAQWDTVVGADVKAAE